MYVAVKDKINKIKNLQDMPDVGLVGVDEGSEHGLFPVLGLWRRHAVEQLHLVLRTRAQEDPQYLGDVCVRDISLRNK